MNSSPRDAVRVPVPAEPTTDTGGPEERVVMVERVPKPWGYEEIFAVLEGGYAGKILHIVAGGELSLQRHLAKDETLAVQSGRVRIEHGPDAARLRTVTLLPGDCLHIPPQVLHRLSADVDSVVLEASTAGAGWRTDVVRLEDRYGRGGTTLP
jgi:mannose-6-phosphate isomerase